MTITESMVSVLFKTETIEKVRQQFKSNNERISIDCDGMNLRLFKATAGNINLELLCRDNGGMYFKPIGYYEFIKGGFLGMNNKLIVYLLKEFAPDYDKLTRNGLSLTNLAEVKFLSLKENGLIAAFSRETIELVKIMFGNKDRSESQSDNSEQARQFRLYPHLRHVRLDEALISNGLKVDLLFCQEGYPQSFLDDEYTGNFGEVEKK